MLWKNKIKQGQLESLIFFTLLTSGGRCVKCSSSKWQKIYIYIFGPFYLKIGALHAYLHTCWQPPGSWHVELCDIHPRCRFLPACLWPAWQYPVLFHSCSSWAWKSFQVPLCYGKEFVHSWRKRFGWEIQPRAEAKTKGRKLTSFDQLVFPEPDTTAGQWWSRSTCQPSSSAWADFWPVAHQTGFYIKWHEKNKISKQQIR